MWRNLLIPFLMIIAGPCAAADDCAPIPNLAKGNGPVFHQRNFSWCHSLTTTDLLTQKMHRTGALKPGQRLHPFGTAAVLHIMTGSAPDDRRYHVDTVLNNLRTMAEWNDEGGRMCLESNLGSTRYDLNNIAQLAGQEQIDVLRKHVTYKNGQFVRIGPYARSCLSRQAVFKVMDDMRAAERQAWITGMNKRCKTEMPPIKWKYKWRPEWTHEINGTLQGEPDPDRVTIIRSEIDSALEQGAIVGVEYKPDFMLKKSSENHWSSVIARERRSDGQCYYQIRNSWGLSCKYYREPKNCTAGNIWVKRDDLVKNTDATTYLE